MLLETLEKLLNRGLPRSPRARALCAELAGHSVALEFTDLARLRLSSNGVTLVLHADEQPAAATLQGGPLGFLGLLAERSPRTALQRGAVTLSGDTELAERFFELLQRLRPDVEEELALVVGDVPAHQLGRLARGGLAFARRALATGGENLAEYFAHETADLVPRTEGEQFLRGVDELREDVDRLGARLDALAQRRAHP
jgi:ubiquinone biosynthesis accessory factor UbiJ